ncbi:flavodoxin domain-containing protein [Methanomassiliicoccus luminyensis]|jgi:flavodoxin|uniref:flavodoxin domain-containing protein n=1 Tax=Methanomassiliicoccus luminyensis TaxID=1080712 RepID=UPI00036EDBAB|nr:flavodoxin domain-containing protein [Methanomassiliicoccus luminyensis]
MKGFIAYDTVHGSTKAAAEAIAERLRERGHEVEIVSIKDGGVPPTSGDCIFIGSPTRGGTHTKGAREFIESMDASYWNGRPVVLFDTLGPMPKKPNQQVMWMAVVEQKEATAAQSMRKQCAGRGIRAREELCHLPVKGMWGPLREDAPSAAKEYTREFLEDMEEPGEVSERSSDPKPAQLDPIINAAKPV